MSVYLNPSHSTSQSQSLLSTLYPGKPAVLKVSDHLNDWNHITYLGNREDRGCRNLLLESATANSLLEKLGIFESWDKSIALYAVFKNGSCRNQGVKSYFENDQLKFSAPNGFVTDEIFCYSEVEMETLLGILCTHNEIPEECMELMTKLITVDKCDPEFTYRDPVRSTPQPQMALPSKFSVYPGRPALLELQKYCLNDWNRPYEGVDGACRAIALNSVTEGSLLLRVELFGYRNGAISLFAVLRDEDRKKDEVKAYFNPFWNNTLQSCIIANSNSLQRIQTLFQIIISNNKIPEEHLGWIAKIITAGRCEPMVEIEDGEVMGAGRAGWWIDGWTFY